MTYRWEALVLRSIRMQPQNANSKYGDQNETHLSEPESEDRIEIS